MSLILEALKKSEAKRRLGEAPDLGTPFTAPRRRSVVLPVAIVLIAAALVWWGFFSGSTAPSAGRNADNQNNRSTVPAASAPAVGQKSGTPLRRVGADNPTNAAPPSSPPKPEEHASEPSFVAVGPTPAPGGNDAPPMYGRRRDGLTDAARRQATMNAPPPPGGGFQSRSRRVPPAALASAAPPPSNAAPAVPTRSVAPAAPSISQNPTTTPTTAAVATNTAAATPAAGVPNAAPAPKAVEATSSAPEARAPKGPGTIGAPVTTPPVNASAAAPQNAQPYSELAFSVRKSLPELRLSMHVYTADPAQRFVILNDSRLGEGEKTTDDVFVREVRPDGVVLEFQSQRFFYPRDGL